MATFSLATLRRGADLMPALGIGGWYWPLASQQVNALEAEFSAMISAVIQLWARAVKIAGLQAE